MQIKLDPAVTNLVIRAGLKKLNLLPNDVAETCVIHSFRTKLRVGDKVVGEGVGLTINLKLGELH